MKTRRITLIVLILLTVLFIVDVRYFGGRSLKEPSVDFNISPGFRQPEAHKSQEFVRPQHDITSLYLKGRHGVVELSSAEGDEIRVQAIIWSDREEVLEAVEVKESISGRELSYELSSDLEGEEVRLGFVVEVPDGMEVTVEHQFGTVRVENFLGFLNLDTRFANVNLNDVEGTLTIKNSFGNLNLQRIAGPLQLTNAYSTCTVELLPVDGGYDFDIEVVNGSLKHNAGFQVNIGGNNRVGAQGKWGEGVHPVHIRSNFGSVVVNIDK